MKASKFCAGATTGGRDVESIHQAREIATTGTPGGFPASPAAEEWVEFDLWCGFGLLAFCFIMVAIEDKVRG